MDALIIDRPEEVDGKLEKLPLVQANLSYHLCAVQIGGYEMATVRFMEHQNPPILEVFFISRAIESPM